MRSALALVLLGLLGGALQDPLDLDPATLPRAEAGRWAALFDGREVVAAELPMEVAPKVLEARQAYASADFPRALALQQEILAQQPDFPPTLLELGSTYFRLRRYGDARTCLERFLEVAPSQVFRTQALGHCYYSLGEYARARDHYEQVVALEPESAEAVRGLALAHYRLGDPERALALLDRVLELREEHGEALAWKAQILYEEERSEEALAAAEEARSADPYSPRPWFLLARILDDLGREAEALEARDRWEELDRLVQEVRVLEGRLLYHPGDFEMAMRLAAVQREIGDGAATREAFSLALAHRPDDVQELELRIHVLDVLFDMGDPRGAEWAARGLAQACSNEPQAWKRLETYFARIGDAERQVRAGELYLRLNAGE